MKNIIIIVNPSSGQPIPISQIINDELKDSQMKWKILVTSRSGDATRMVKNALKNGVDAIAVYGGDGTVMEVARALVKSSTPLFILPGGTANIMAKELQIPLFIEQSLKMITDESTKYRTIDMGEANGTPFMLRVSMGSMADMIIETHPDLKENVGQLAYSVTAMQKLSQSIPAIYTMTLDGNKEIVEGVTLVVANTANIGLSGVPFIPEVTIDDGYLDVLILKNNDFSSISSMVGEAIFNRSINDTMAHWKVKSAEISVSPKQNILCDDDQIESNHLSIKVLPSAIRVAVPGS